MTAQEVAISTIVNWRLSYIDRLGRSLRDLLDIVAALEERGVGVRSLTNGIVDTTTAHGKLVFACDALAVGGCLKVHKDVATGTKTDRPQRQACLDDLRPGDTPDHLEEVVAADLGRRY